jgi:hypothetical protein
MKATIWVLCTARWKRWRHMTAIRAEWDNQTDQDEAGLYPGNPDEAQDRLREVYGADWGRWQLTCHDIEIPELNALQVCKSQRIEEQYCDQVSCGTDSYQPPRCWLASRLC